MEITKERLLTEINLAIVQKEDFMVRRVEDNETEIIVIVGRYNIVSDVWINPRISSRLTLTDAHDVTIKSNDFELKQRSMIKIMQELGD